jgi:hypothetical protein
VLASLVLLALAAAVIAPSHNLANPESSEAALASNLATIRQALEFYRNDHGGEALDPPDWDSFVEQVTRPTDSSGRLGGPCGPYLRNAFPSNPLTGRADGCIVDAMPARGTVIGLEADMPSWWRVALLEPEATLSGPSWIYCRTTGEFRANVFGAGPSLTPYFDL